MLDVLGQPFETLPLRLYPIKISDPDDDSNRHFSGYIELNGVGFEREMTWDTEQFQQMLKDKLGDAPITLIVLRSLNCSSVTLNELLSVIYFNMA